MIKIILFFVIFSVVACTNEKATLQNDSSVTEQESLPTDDGAPDEDALLSPDLVADIADVPPEEDEDCCIEEWDDLPVIEEADEETVDEEHDGVEEMPDLDSAPSDCQKNTDCPFGSRCDMTVTPHECQPMSTCKNDLDCATYEKCAIVDNWKQCQVNLTPHQCDSEGNCGFGEVCEEVYGIFTVCRSLNECTKNEECLDDQVCESNGQYLTCVTICQVDTDCGFGYRCQPASPHNVCVYANECVRDSDCPSFNTCEAFGNWTRCTINATGKFCSNDDQCDPSEYCDLLIGPIGGCKSRDQCHIDADCGINLVCQNNGVYNECVPQTPKDCFIDAQCPSGWSCAANHTCVPPYAGVCPEIEGLWVVLVSSQLLIPQGTSYEFIPESGCTGKVVPKDQPIESGTFAQTAPGKYDITMALFLACTGELTMATIMEVTCPSGNATLVKGN